MRDLATEFEAERRHLFAVAYRMLGGRAEAEDAVQETWLRYADALADPADRAEIRDLRGWLTTTIGRICLDVLRSARVRREAYPGQWLPEPLVNRMPDGAPDPADVVARSDEVSMALLVVLERLTPEQRVAFVLHDVFVVPFDEIASALGTTVEAARQLASRARRAVADGPPKHTADLSEQRRLAAAFFAAVQSGEIEELMAVLAPDAVMIGDGGGVFPAAGRPLVGATEVARFVLGLFNRTSKDLHNTRAAPVEVNGGFGIQVDGDHKSGLPMRIVVSFAAADGRITGVFNQLSPEKVASVPPCRPTRAAGRRS
ncbi:RNA polymerase sigma factor SigJ [Phytohabitans suffuscus]|uniref:RNA polymerase sigma factor SigJ n=1 Tax=Phytohabitans suffuscus TaxID=624315 RepID=A0A6F8YHU3_9ACTN|nr:RNA polymerase sigma factor SigJ [Phytohabitans suffuscus]BCB85511.1 RNA polymerase sigma factor SigJ [Phytohabitans suffuscus]